MRADLNRKRILLTGGTGLVGRSFLRVASADVEIFAPRRKDMDLLSKVDVEKTIGLYKPTHIVHLAARVGGLKDNIKNQAEFFEQNTQIALNVLGSAAKHSVRKTVSLLSSCVYPADVKYPIEASTLHDGPPHVSNYGYAYGKRMIDVYGRTLNEQLGRTAFITLVPNNLYGPNDNFSLESSHFIPSLIRKFHSFLNFGKPIVMWGSGQPEREFTYADDVSKIILASLDNYNNEEPLNIGNPVAYSIRGVVEIMCNMFHVGPNAIQWDLLQPDGQLKKPTKPGNSQGTLNDLLNWKVNDYTTLAAGLWKTYNWFEKNYPNVRGI